MTGNTWWLTKVGAKLLSDLVILSIFSSDIQFHFHKSIQVVPLKYSKYFLSGINTKKIWNISHEKHFAPLKILFAKYAEANLAVFFLAVNIYFWTVIYLSWSWSFVILFLVSLIFCVIVSFFYLITNIWHFIFNSCKSSSRSS